MDEYQRAASYAERIERELRGLGVWQSAPLPSAAYESRQAFFADTMTFYQWLQFVLLVRVREIVDKRGEFPRGSSVGAYAVRELDGCEDTGELVAALCAFDEFIEGLSAE